MSCWPVPPRARIHASFVIWTGVEKSGRESAVPSLASKSFRPGFHCPSGLWLGLFLDSGACRGHNKGAFHLAPAFSSHHLLKSRVFNAGYRAPPSYSPGPAIRHRHPCKPSCGTIKWGVVCRTGCRETVAAPWHRRGRATGGRESGPSLKEKCTWGRENWSSRGLDARSGCSGADNVVVKSSDGRPSVQVGARIRGAASRINAAGDEMVIEPSPLGLTIDGTPRDGGARSASAWWGRMRPIRGGASIPRHATISTASRSGNAHAKRGEAHAGSAAFDDGAGFRYVLSDSGKHRVAGEDTAFQLPRNCAIWGQTNTTNYEGFYERVALGQAKEGTCFGPPVVVELPAGGYAALTEAALFNYSGMTLQVVGGGSRRLGGVPGR
jgi:hypothetical protein